MKKLLTSLAVISSALTLSACQHKKMNTLIFATEATYPPFVSMTSQNKMTGFGPDIVHAVCHSMHKQCQLVNAPWESLIPSLKMGKYDVLFGGMAITQDREKVVNFSLSYYQNAVVYVVNKAKKLQLTQQGMAGKTIGVQGGSTFETYIKQTYANKVKLKTYQSNMTALLDLKAGRINAVFIDKPVATAWLKKPGNQNFTTQGKIIDKILFGPGNAFAINKNNKKLQKNINQALMQLKNNGTLTKLEQKWFGK